MATLESVGRYLILDTLLVQSNMIYKLNVPDGGDEGGGGGGGGCSNKHSILSASLVLVAYIRLPETHPNVILSPFILVDNSPPPSTPILFGTGNIF